MAGTVRESLRTSRTSKVSKNQPPRNLVPMQPPEDQLQMAAHYVQDALDGRLEHGKASCSIMSKRAQWCMAIHTSETFANLLYACFFVQLLLNFWEPVDSIPMRLADWPAWPLALDVCFVALTAFDIALKLNVVSFRKYITKRWQQLYFFFCLTNALDIVLLLAGVGRPLRCLRGFLLVLRSRTLRRMCAAIFGVWHVLLSCTLALLLLLATIASLGHHLFYVDYQSTEAEPLSEFGPMYDHAFDTLPRGFQQAFIPCTTDHAMPSRCSRRAAHTKRVILLSRRSS